MTIKALIAALDSGDTIQVNLAGPPALRASAFVGAVMSYDAIHTQEVAKVATIQAAREKAASEAEEAKVRQEQSQPDGA